MPSQEDLQKKRDKAEKLRAQIADAETVAATSAQEQSNVLESAQLDAELARLEVRLAQAKAAAKVSAAKEGASGPLAAVKDQLEAAEAAKGNTVGPVDTNAGVTDEQKGGNS